MKHPIFRRCVWCGVVGVLVTALACGARQYMGRDRHGNDQWVYDCDPKNCGNNVSWSATNGWNSSCTLRPQN